MLHKIDHPWGKADVIRTIMKYVERYPAIRKILSPLLWRINIFSDFMIAYVFRAKIKATTPFGFDLVSRKYSANRQMLTGTFESEEIDIIKDNLISSDVFVDVGANIGYYTCLALSLGKHAVAVEPQLQNLECLYENLSINGWPEAEVFPLGLSHEPGLLVLYGASGLCASLVKGWAGYPERFKQIIPVNTMDNILGERFNGKKIFIKIDVEGAEYQVLRGAEKTLAMSPRPTWLIEISPGLFHPGGSNPHYADTFRVFWEHGYEVHLANKDKRLITSADIENLLEVKGALMNKFNFLFVPKRF